MLIATCCRRLTSPRTDGPSNAVKSSDRSIRAARIVGRLARDGAQFAADARTAFGLSCDAFELLLQDFAQRRLDGVGLGSLAFRNGPKAPMICWSIRFVFSHIVR
jgi:hypothetical protein